MDVLVPVEIIKHINYVLRPTTTTVVYNYEQRLNLSKQMFIHQINVQYVCRLLKTKDINQVKAQMVDYISDADLLVNNPIESIHTMNTDFIKQYGSHNGRHDHSERHADILDINTARYDEIVNGDFNGMDQKSIMKGGPEIYSQLDIKQEQVVMRDASKFRSRNKLPFYQTSMNDRPYERDISDTLHAFGERFSHSRGFNMSQLETPTLDKITKGLKIQSRPNSWSRKAASLPEFNLTSSYDNNLYFTNKYNTNRYSATELKSPRVQGESSFKYPIGDSYLPETISDKHI